MGFFEILLIGAALAMDACAIAMTNGMTMPKMKIKKAALIALTFGFFQFLMPLLGFGITQLFANVFMDTFEKISAWVSFGLLAFLGGKMLAESIRCMRAMKTVREISGQELVPCACEVPKLTVGKLLMQAVATSIDALAVGVTLKMATLSAEGLALGVWGATGVIGGVTFVLALGAVYIGKLLGDKLADKAGLFGGVVLIAIGLKILIEGLL